MMHDLAQKILARKVEKDVAILAHSYQAHEILEIADRTGDSFALSRMATALPQQTLLMCGVRFMAETVKLLSPEKKVILVSPEAGCPMAEQFTREDVLAWKAAHPGGVVVAYVNTTTELKRAADYCVTSASAVKIVAAIPDEKEILFIPDRNLGSYVQKMLPQKKMHFWHGGCPLHAAVTPEELDAARRAHPHARLLTHPECIAEVASESDYVGSTSGIMDYARSSDEKEFIIGTETSIVSHLQYELPDKCFYPLSKRLVCHDMRLTTLPDVLHAIEGTGGEEILLDGITMREARLSIDKMIELG